ncbi:MAG TPA: integrase, partial [Methylococcaceae bacterium]|nr:integrase [Methylococcaceae bacterium]HIB62996.1 integrase [Methylococcaceae bacterium]
TIPAERTKTKREHRIPLSDAAIAIFNSIDHSAGNPYVFPGSRQSRPLSNMALLKLMRDKGYGANGDKGKYVPHGFRSSFPRDVAEMALAHTIENKTKAAYRRGDLFEKRSVVMQD